MLETTTYALVGSRVCEPYLSERKKQNFESWHNKNNWFLGFYFSKTDSRLWVPRRLKNGTPWDAERVINFSHRQARKAFRILMLAYATGFALATTLVLYILGVRW